mgnify:FL=1
MANMSKRDFSCATVTAKTPAPDLVSELLEAFRDPDPDLDHIVDLIADDPSLKAEVLRRGNSVIFGGGAPAADVFEAVSRIGMYEAYSAVLAMTHLPRNHNQPALGL